MQRAPRIGVVAAGSARAIRSARAGLEDLGLVEREDFCLEARAAEGDIGELPRLVSEVLASGVDIIAAVGAVTVEAVRAATTSIPMVYAVVVDPRDQTLAAAGANTTGITTFDRAQARMHVEMLRAVAPRCARIAILAERRVSSCLPVANIRAVEQAGMSASLIEIAGPCPDLRAAFAAMEEARVDGLIVVEHPVNAGHSTDIAELATGRGLPTVFARDQSDANGLFSFGASLQHATRHMMRHVLKVLEGHAASEVPVETLHQHELLVNLSTARRLGLDVPPDLLARVTRTEEQL